LGKGELIDYQLYDLAGLLEVYDYDGGI
jgi:hypothetical protein